MYCLKSVCIWEVYWVFSDCIGKLHLNVKGKNMFEVLLSYYPRVCGCMCHCGCGCVCICVYVWIHVCVCVCVCVCCLSELRLSLGTPSVSRRLQPGPRLSLCVRVVLLRPACSRCKGSTPALAIT